MPRLEPVLARVAAAYSADLYLPSGEDGRRMVVLAFSDCDPAGWQMPTSIARELFSGQTN